MQCSMQSDSRPHQRRGVPLDDYSESSSRYNRLTAELNKHGSASSYSLNASNRGSYQTDGMAAHTPEPAVRRTSAEFYSSHSIVATATDDRLDGHSDEEYGNVTPVESDGCMDLELKRRMAASVSTAEDMRISRENLCAAATALSASEIKKIEKRRIKAENDRLRREITCHKCHKQRVQTLFLPCRHLVTCEQCAEHMDDCLKCRQKILGTVRTFLL